MRRSLFALTIAIVLVVSAQFGRAQDLVVSRFRDYLESLRVQAGIPALAATIVGSNDVIWEQAFGRQDIDRAIPATPTTPFQFDGVTQVFTAAIVLRCVEEGRLSLDDRIGQYSPDSAEPNATIQQLLSHTSGPPENPVFAYRPDRLEPLKAAIRACTGDSFRETLAHLLERLAMFDSVPGYDADRITPPAEGVPTPVAAERYTKVLANLAVPYVVDQQRRASPSQYTVTTISPSSGLISTVRDVAQFYLALRKNGVLVRPESLGVAWLPPLGSDGQRLPHGLGWFVQSFSGQTVVWQFGLAENASSSLVVTIPGRGLTLILAANSDGLAKPFHLQGGDVTASPFARVFLNLFAR